MRLAVVLLLATFAGAQNLTPLATHTTANLRGVSAPSNTVVWASGTGGTYLRTTDAGQNWTVSRVPGAEQLDFRDVEAFNENVAYLLAAGPGTLSRIYKTTDGGSHWTLQLKNEDPRGFYDCMAFWDQTHGIALGDSIDGEFQLFATDDGEHWHQLPTNKLPTSLEGEGAFAASGTCIAVQGQSNAWFATGGKVARAYRSTDRGQTWQVSETALTHGLDSTGIFSIVFRDAKHGVIAGGDYQKPKQSGHNLAFTEDGGETWTLSSLAPQAYYSAAAYTPSGNLLLAGTSGAALISADPASTRLLHSWNPNLNALSVAPDGTAYAVGPKGLIVRISPR
jgi:photosystem II stability/assembly factor-like uncharacterized protein